MKHIKSTLILVFISFFALTSCDKDDDEALVTATVVQEGKWKVTLFSEDNVNETHHFAGYEFTFNNDGTVSALRNNVTTTGYWSTGTDDSQRKLILDFIFLSTLSELSEDWRVVELTNTKVRLEHLSGDNGNTDLLTLERI
jgi:hypothetical protein